MKNLPSLYLLLGGTLVAGFFGLIFYFHKPAPVDHTPHNRANLAGIRSALTLYTNDHQGKFPPDLNGLVPKYLPDIPTVSELEHHQPTHKVTVGKNLVSTDEGGWFYVYNPGSKHNGEVHINCSHSNGSAVWFNY